MGGARIRLLGYCLATAFLVAALAFMNRYPLVYSDSGTYIRSAFTLVPPLDRPIGYGLIIRAVTWQSTLWTVVLFQGAVLSWLLYELLVEVVAVRTRVRLLHMSIIAVLLVASSMPWYAAQIMPDALTPQLGIALFLWMFGSKQGPIKRVFLGSVILFYAIAHNSHMAMSVLSLAGLNVLGLLSGGKERPYLLRSLGLWTILGAGVSFAVLYNAANGLPAKFSPSTNVFFCGRLCEDEIMKDYLDKHCPETDHVLCPYKDSLPGVPGDLIWGSNSIVNRLGGDMIKADSLLAPVVHDLLSEPEYFGRYVRSAFVGSVVQMFQVKTNSGIVPYGRDSAPQVVIERHLPWELGQFTHSRQAHGDWDLALVDMMVYATLLLSLVLLAFAWPRGAGSAPAAGAIRWLIAWVVLNAVITSSLANVYDRLQSRVAWLIVLCALIALARTPKVRELLEPRNP